MQNFDYKNQLLDICNNFNTTIKSYISLVNDANYDIINHFKDGQTNYLAALEEYKEQVSKNDLYKSDIILAFNKQIEDVQSGLEKDLAEFELIHNISKEQKKVFDNRDRTLRLKKSNLEKQKEELQSKISGLEKECFDLIRTNEESLDKIEKEYKKNNLELDKKTKYEINNIDESILMPNVNNSDSGVESDIDNNGNGIRNKEVMKIRKAGIIEIANKQKEFFNAQMTLEIEYTTSKETIKADITTIKAKYDLQILELRKRISELNNKLKDEEYFANYNALLLIYETEAKNGLTANQMRLEAINNIKAIKDKINVKNTDPYLQRNKVIKDVLTDDTSMIDNYFNYLDTLQENFKLRVEEVKKFVSSYLNCLLDVMTSLINIFIDDINTLQNECMNLLVERKYKNAYLGEFNYDSFNKDLDNILIDFVSNENKQRDYFNKELKKQIEVITKQFDSCFSSVLAYSLRQMENLKKHKENITNLIKENLLAGYMESKRLDAIDTNRLLKCIEEDEKEYNSKVGSINKDNQGIKNVFNNKNEKIKSEKQEYLNVYALERNKELADYNSQEKVLLKISKTTKNKQDKDIKAKKQEIRKEFKAFINKVDNDKKIKLQMCDLKKK